MELTLNTEEQELLPSILDRRHRELVNEIAHTDHREFKQDLRQDERLLDSLLEPRARSSSRASCLTGGLVLLGRLVAEKRSFEEINHTADRAFRVTGREAALLKNAACAMQALEGVPPPAEASATREIEVEGVDRETLLVNWLNEILYLEQVDRLVCTDFQIYECKNHHVRGRVETRDAERRLTHIKAVTFHNLKVRETLEGLEAEIVVDV